MVFDSRGIPTIEAEVYLNNGNIGRAIAPSGASKGKNEAVEKRDKKKKFLGLSVDKNIVDIKNKINNGFVGQSVLDQNKLDSILLEIDGTKNKRVLGANTTTAVSMATIKAAAKFKNKELWEYLNLSNNALMLPIPQVQIFGGGAHANILIFLTKIIEKSGFKLLKDVSIALDIAANNFYNKSLYNLNKKKMITADQLLDTFIEWTKKYPIISIEDPFSEEDILYYQKLFNKAPKYVQIIGDDLVVTNKKLISKAVNKKTINSILIKPNQIGTISETFDALKLSRDLGLVEVISARSGETEDVTIADLSIGWQTNQIKVGSFSRSERLAKWNQCLRIGEQIKNNFAMQKNTILNWDKL